MTSGREFTTYISDRNRIKANQDYVKKKIEPSHIPAMIRGYSYYVDRLFPNSRSRVGSDELFLWNHFRLPTSACTAFREFLTAWGLRMK